MNIVVFHGEFNGSHDDNFDDKVNGSPDYTFCSNVDSLLLSELNEQPTKFIFYSLPFDSFLTIIIRINNTILSES